MRNMQKLATESVPRDGEAAARLVRAWSGMDVSADAQDMQPTRSAASGAAASAAGVAEKTGWPMPELMQDDCRPLFRWFASKPDSRHLVRIAAAVIVTHEPRINPSHWVHAVGGFNVVKGVCIAPVLAVDFYANGAR